MRIKPKEENQTKNQRIYKLNLMSTTKVVLLAAMRPKGKVRKIQRQLSDVQSYFLPNLSYKQEIMYISSHYHHIVSTKL